MSEADGSGIVDVDVLVSGLLGFRKTLQKGCRDWEVEILDTILSNAGVIDALDDDDDA